MIPPYTDDAFEVESIAGNLIRGVPIGMTRDRGRTIALSRATRSSSARNSSGTRNPPSDGTVDE